MAFVTDSNRPQPLWRRPPTACPTASGTASEAPALLMHPWWGDECPLELQPTCQHMPALHMPWPSPPASAVGDSAPTPPAARAHPCTPNCKWPSRSCHHQTSPRRKWRALRRCPRPRAPNTPGRCRRRGPRGGWCCRARRSCS